MRIDAAPARLMRSLSVAGDVCRGIVNPTLFFSSRQIIITRLDRSSERAAREIDLT